ncbi:hypothetical protein PFISCL1PPCAC_6878, partial [Pristionchus fissidentatus]
MNWLGIFALILLLNTLLLASILAFFVIHHLTTSNPAAAAAPAAATIASAVPTRTAILLYRYSAAPTVPACPICPVSATVLQTTTVIESTTTTITSTTVDASMESQKLLLKLLDAYLEANRNHLSHHSPYDAPPSHSPEIYPGVVEGSAIYEELLKKLKFAEAKVEHNYEQAPPYPVGSSAVCSMQLDVEAVSKCAVW